MTYSDANLMRANPNLKSNKEALKEEFQKEKMLQNCLKQKCNKRDVNILWSEAQELNLIFSSIKKKDKPV